jgi:hypothetical protein
MRLLFDPPLEEGRPPWRPPELPAGLADPGGPQLFDPPEKWKAILGWVTSAGGPKRFPL